MFSFTLFKQYCGPAGYQEFEINKKLIRVKAKETIFAEGDEVKGIYFIEEGEVKVLSNFGKHEKKILRFAGKGTIIGHRGFNTRRYPISAEALTNTVLAFIPNQNFVNILKGNPELSIYLIGFMTAELQEAESRMINLLVLSPKFRIAKIILELVDIFGYDRKITKKLGFTPSRKDLANFAGTTYETVIRTLSYFEKKGIIRLEGKEIVISNEAKLRAEAKNK